MKKYDKIPQFDALIIPVIGALKKLGGHGTNKQIINTIISDLNISKEISEIPHNDIDSRTELEYRAAWARTYLKKAGYINNPSRAYWEINDKMNIENINPTEIIEFVRKQAPEMAKSLEFQKVSKIEASQGFEKYVTKTLNDYFTFKEKKHELYKNAFKPDFYIPNGIDNIKKDIYVEIKYGDASNLELKIDNFCKSATKWINNENEHILFVVNEKLKDKNIIIQKIKQTYDIDITIWDLDDFTEKIPVFPVNLDYLSNPRASIIEDVIKDNTEDKLVEENDEKLKALTDAYKNEKLVLFLGAGVSIDAGIPLWNELINRLLLRMINLKIQNDIEEDNNEDNHKIFKDNEIKNISNIALENKEETPLMQMRYIRAALDEDKYYNAVHDELYANNININTKLLNAIANISTPRRQHKGLESIVTYNFDDLVEQSLKKRNIDYNVIQSDSKMPVSDKLNIYHVHGYLTYDNNDKDERAELIFSEEDYHRIYKDAYCWSNMAQVKAFQDNICLFVGCSLTDPNLRRLLDSAMKFTETRHFAILKRKNFKLNSTSENTEAIKWYQKLDDGIRNQIYKSFGINVIWVNEFNEIPEILNNLVK